MSTDEKTSEWKDIYKQYEEAANWLNSDEIISGLFGKASTTAEFRKLQEIRFARVQAFIAFLDNPQASFHAIHIAGTGGKGSTATMVEALLRFAGEKTGLHTSPYIQIPNEKLLVDGRMIAPAEFVQGITAIRALREVFMQQYPHFTPVYSDIWTGFMFRFFQQQKITWAVVEAEVGGRLDVTNVLNADVAVITNIDRDHIPELGTTIEQIAWHKAGIIKQGRSVVVGQIKTEALAVIAGEAQIKHAPLYVYERDFQARNIRFVKNGMQADIHTPFGNFADIYINLIGQYQAVNAATAVMAVAVAAHEHGIALSRETVAAALATIIFPGRMERMQDNPLVIIDGAHNPQKMAAAARALEVLYPSMSKTLVIGMVANKDARGTLTPILPLVKRVMATTPGLSWKPSYSAAEMQAMVREIQPDMPVVAYDDVVTAIGESIRTSESNQLIFVTGSIYMLEHVRNLWYPVEEILQELERDYPLT
jgi:dihydrofolate synthase / folylpolyglutamate synthase